MQSKTIKWKLAQTIELRWWKNYLGDKNPTEYRAWKKQYWLNLLSGIWFPAPVNGFTEYNFVNPHAIWPLYCVSVF